MKSQHMYKKDYTSMDGVEQEKNGSDSSEPEQVYTI